MRDFLNTILSFIGESSLTDTEFATVTAEFTLYEKATYDDLTAIIVSRGGVDLTQKRLQYYFQSAGYNAETYVAPSNILIGGPVE